MRPVFVRMIGEPDNSTDIGDQWGDVEFAGGIPAMYDFVYPENRRFVIGLTTGKTSETLLSINEPQLLVEAQR